MFQDTGSDLGGRYPHRRSGMRLITQRSQVQILPPLQVKVQVRGPFDLRIEGAFGVDVRRMYAPSAAGRGRTGPDSGVRWTRSRRQSDPRRCGNRSRNPDGCLESRRHRHVRRTPESGPVRPCPAALGAYILRTSTPEALSPFGEGGPLALMYAECTHRVPPDRAGQGRTQACDGQEVDVSRTLGGAATGAGTPTGASNQGATGTSVARARRCARPRSLPRRLRTLRSSAGPRTANAASSA